MTKFLQRGKTHDPFDIPLFPLKTVLFPGGILPLKVFEPRYMEMVSACLRDKQPFGVCLILKGAESGKPAQHVETGCTVEVTDGDMQLPGVLNIRTIGLQRFYIEDAHTRPNGLVIASAVHIAPEPPQHISSGHRVCADLLRRLVEHLGEERFKPPLNYDDAVWVGYRLAELLPLKLSARQNMLEMNDSLVRIEILHTFLAQQGLLS